MATPRTQSPGIHDRRGRIELTAAQALVRFLINQRSEQDGVVQPVIAGFFGIFGHGNVCGLGEALAEAQDAVRLYQPKNEQSMVHTAIGYAKVKRRLSTFACTASIGPGSTNMVTGAATATVNRLPVLLLPSDTFANRQQGPVLQQLEHPVEADLTASDCFRPVSRFFDRITRPEQLLTALPEAIRVLLDPAETGAVTITLHQDVQGEAYDYPLEFFEQRVWHVVRRPPAEEELRAAVGLITKAERPLIIAGGGVHYSQAATELATLARRVGIPVAETSAGKGSLQDDDLSVGGIGVNGTRPANALAQEADLVLCVGTRLTDFTTASHSLFQHPDVRFVSVNISSRDAHKLAALPIVGDAKLALAALEDRLSSQSWATVKHYREEIVDKLADWRDAIADDLRPRQGELLSQGEVIAALNAESRTGDWVVAAAGSPPGDLLKLWDTRDSAATHIEFGYSCMGHEIPAALGIRLAQPDGGVFVVLGDGGYLMSPSELVTASQERLAVTVLLIDNCGFQSIHALQRSSLGTSFANEFRRRTSDGALAGPPIGIDYAQSARSFGCEAFTADSVETLRAALGAARTTEGPAVIVIQTEPQRGLLSGGAFWDLGVPEVSSSEAIAERASVLRERRAREQRFHG